MSLHRPNSTRRPHYSTAAILAMSISSIIGSGSQLGQARYSGPYRKSAVHKPQRGPRKKKKYNRACQCGPRRR